MRKQLLSLFAAFAAFSATAQTVSTFDTLSLSGPDTAYINYSMPGMDVGFSDADAYFPCIYDTSFGGIWTSGFAYSNETDTITSGYLNQYAAKPGTGYGGSSQYAVFWQGYGSAVKVSITGASAGLPVQGFYITNSTYAYNSMRDGDGFAKKFGGATGTDPDFFKLQIKGYHNGTLGADSVEFYLADFRSSNSANDSIVRGWNWVNLLPLGNVDSIQFQLFSSDTAFGYTNTPTYFCMDNFTTSGAGTSVGNTAGISDLKVYPNPATDMLYISARYGHAVSAMIYDASGRLVLKQALVNSENPVSVASLPQGSYFLTISDAGKKASLHFVKR